MNKECASGGGERKAAKKQLQKVRNKKKTRQSTIKLGSSIE